MNWTNIHLIALAAYAAINLITYWAFWRDKRRAIQGKQRISEAKLMTLAFIGGAPFAKIAQRSLRHKTLKEPFRSDLNVVFAFHVLALVVLYQPLRLATIRALRLIIQGLEYIPVI